MRFMVVRRLNHRFCRINVSNPRVAPDKDAVNADVRLRQL